MPSGVRGLSGRKIYTDMSRGSPRAGGLKESTPLSSSVYKGMTHRDQETELANTFRRMEAIRRQEQRLYQAKIDNVMSKQASKVLGMPKSRDLKLFKKEYF